jgi:antitoxin Phd
MSIEESDALSSAANRNIDPLRRKFDALLTRMQTRQSRSAMRAAFNASPEELGKAAVPAARKGRLE